MQCSSNQPNAQPLFASNLAMLAHVASEMALQHNVQSCQFHPRNVASRIVIDLTGDNPTKNCSTRVFPIHPTTSEICLGFPLGCSRINQSHLRKTVEVEDVDFIDNFFRGVISTHVYDSDSTTIETFYGRHVKPCNSLDEIIALFPATDIQSRHQFLMVTIGLCPRNRPTWVLECTFLLVLSMMVNRAMQLLNGCVVHRCSTKADFFEMFPELKSKLPKRAEVPFAATNTTILCQYVHLMLQLKSPLFNIDRILTIACICANNRLPFVDVFKFRHRIITKIAGKDVIPSIHFSATDEHR